MPFVGEISFAYTFIDDFFVFGLNRPTIRHVIDVANAGDAGKKRLLDEHTLPSGTFFSLLFDGEGMSQAIQSLYEKNVKTLPRYMKSLVTEQTSLTSLLSEYVVSYEKAKRLSETPPPFDHTL